MSKIFDGKLKRVGGVRHSEYSEYLERKKHGDFVVKGGVFTDSERAFYSKLELVTERFPLRPLVKVALKDIFDIKDSFLNHNQIHLERLKNYYIDFLVCDEETMIPLLAIFLGKHNLDEMKFIEGLFEEFEIKIAHDEEKEEYNVIELIQIMELNIDMKSLIK